MNDDHIVCVQDHTTNIRLSHGEKWDVYYAIDYLMDTPEDSATRGHNYIQALVDAGFIKNEEESGSRQGVYETADKKLKAIVDWKEGDKGLYFWFGIKS